MKYDNDFIRDTDITKEDLDCPKCHTVATIVGNVMNRFNDGGNIRLVCPKCKRTFRVWWYYSLVKR